MHYSGFGIWGEYKQKMSRVIGHQKLVLASKPQNICVSADQYNKMSAPSLSPQANDKKIALFVEPNF
jgi:hypothetical protein